MTTCTPRNLEKAATPFKAMNCPGHILIYKQGIQKAIVICLALW